MAIYLTREFASNIMCLTRLIWRGDIERLFTIYIDAFINDDASAIRRHDFNPTAYPFDGRWGPRAIPVDQGTESVSAAAETGSPVPASPAGDRQRNVQGHRAQE
jgi:hypothetical protein